MGSLFGQTGRTIAATFFMLSLVPTLTVLHKEYKTRWGKDRRQWPEDDLIDIRFCAKGSHNPPWLVHDWLITTGLFQRTLCCNIYLRHDTSPHIAVTNSLCKCSSVISSQQSVVPGLSCVLYLMLGSKDLPIFLDRLNSMKITNTIDSVKQDMMTSPCYTFPKKNGGNLIKIT